MLLVRHHRLQNHERFDPGQVLILIVAQTADPVSRNQHRHQKENRQRLQNLQSLNLQRQKLQRANRQKLRSVLKLMHISNGVNVNSDSKVFIENPVRPLKDLNHQKLPNHQSHQNLHNHQSHHHPQCRQRAQVKLCSSLGSIANVISAHPPCYDCNNPCNDCDGNENNILNVNFAPINTNQQNWININTEIETDVNVNVSDWPISRCL